jgi:histidyl-tRNA synthetase
LAQVDALLVVIDEKLLAEGLALAMKLRGAGRSVDVVLETKKMKWVFKVKCA